MKAKTLLLCLCLCCLFPMHAQTFIAEQQALSIAMQEFQGRDVDYCLIENLMSSPTVGNWSIFVDAEPMKGWEHECYIITIPKSMPTGMSQRIQKERRMLPPSDYMRPLSVKNRYGSNLKK